MTKAFFGGCKKGCRILRLPPRAISCHKRWKSISFCEIWNNLTLVCSLLGMIKFCMINLWIDSRTCQKYRVLLSSRQRSNNYLELSKENVLGNMMLPHWPYFTWKFFMIWFHKIPKLIFQKQPSCPRDICIEHWRKPPVFTAFLEIFLYFKKNDSVDYA